MTNLNERLYFFSDLDGTLLYNKIGKYEPNTKNTATIQNFVERGHSFVMTTGRELADVNKIAAKLQIPVEYAITYNGAFIYKNGKEIFSNTLSIDQIIIILKAVKELGMPYGDALLFSETGTIYFQPHSFLGHMYKLSKKVLPFSTSKIRPWKKSTLRTLVHDNTRIPKLCFMSNKPRVIAALERKLHSIFNNRLSIYRSSPNMLELCDASVDKATAIQFIMQRESLPMNHVAFVGDSGNDVKALMALQHAYVMSHAAAEYGLDGVSISPDVAGAIAHFIDVYRDY